MYAPRIVLHVLKSVGAHSTTLDVLPPVSRVALPVGRPSVSSTRGEGLCTGRLVEKGETRSQKSRHLIPLDKYSRHSEKTRL